MTARARREAGGPRGEPRALRVRWSELGRALALSLLLALALCWIAPAAAAEAGEPSKTMVVASSDSAQRESRSVGMIGATPAPKPVRTPIVYQPPRRGSPERGRVGGGVRGGSKAFATPLALVPDHLAYTVSASPSIFWHVDGAVEGARVFFSIMDEDDINGLSLEAELDSPSKAGIYRVRLAELGIALAEETEYHWFIAVVPDVANRDRDRISDGFVRRVDEPSLAVGETDASTFAEQGIWYDALESLSDAIDTDPADPELRAQRSSLLLQAGLEVAAR